MSAYRDRRRDDLEAGSGRSDDYEDDDDSSSGPFDITSTKNAPIKRLKRWRVSLSLRARLISLTLLLNLLSVEIFKY